MIVLTAKDVPGFKHEAGGHRWQETSGTGRKARVHTSTVTVSVLYGTQKQAATEDEFEVQFFSGTGKGGQHRNKHQNCVRMIHRPTGLVQTASSRSREANLLEARAKLEVRLSERRTQISDNRRNEVRSAQIGSGQRGDKRRTYRFQDDQVVDHETGKRTTCSRFMKGALDELW